MKKINGKFDFSIEKVNIFDFFDDKKFQNHFLQEKLLLFDTDFFLPQNSLVLQGFMLRVAWESLSSAPPKDLFKNLQLRTFNENSFHIRMFF